MSQDLAKEVRIWSELDHPNILRLFGFFLEGANAIPNFISEWMEKGTLADYYKEYNPSAKDICNMVRTE